jgi:hypothetical protein
VSAAAAPSGRSLSRLEKLLFRLESQLAVLAFVAREIEGRNGVVFELGLGKGRTYDHLRQRLPGREIFVFEREVDTNPWRMPDPSHLIMGEMAETLPAMARRFAGKVVLAHSDVGSFDRAHNAAMAALVSRLLPPALVPGALVVADLPLSLPGCAPVPLPEGAIDGRYFLYRRGE